MTTEATVVFVVVVGLRFLVPLLIPRFPLPAVLACLVLDGIDQTIFQTFGFDPPGYQNYDKAMDLFYLSIAFLSSLQNWTHSYAVGISRFLFFYRMVGVMAFEISGERTLLLIFPNTFEYFFIAYEVVRLRWDPRRFSRRFWLVTAAAIWIFVKLPQEYWIHVAQLDFTDTWKNVSWFAPLVVTAVLAGLAVLWFVVRPRLLPPDWTWRVAADPLPAEMDTAAERDAWTAANVRVWSGSTLEKVVAHRAAVDDLRAHPARPRGVRPADVRRHRGLRRRQRRDLDRLRPSVRDPRGTGGRLRRARRRQPRPGAAGPAPPRRQRPGHLRHGLLRAPAVAARHDARPVRAGRRRSGPSTTAPTRPPPPAPPPERPAHICAWASCASTSGERRSSRRPPRTTPAASRARP